MPQELYAALVFGVLIVAFLYSSVGHAGASGYIAAMALAGLSPTVIKPVALVLNIAVALIASWQFWCAGCFRWRLFWPFAALSVPCAFLGGYITMPGAGLKLGLGLVLWFSATRLIIKPSAEVDTHPPQMHTALGTGAGLGLISGLTGTGGGIFLTPLMMLCRWAPTKKVAAVSAVFILVNSIAGLGGCLAHAGGIPSLAWSLLGAAVTGGLAGSFLGSQRYSPLIIKRLLAGVLAVAGTKLILI